MISQSILGLRDNPSQFHDFFGFANTISHSMILHDRYSQSYFLLQFSLTLTAVRLGLCDI